MTRFGECSGFPHRMVLLYDGIHYDPLYLQLPGQRDKQTFFPVSDLRYDPLYLQLPGQLDKQTVFPVSNLRYDPLYRLLPG